MISALIAAAILAPAQAVDPVAAAAVQRVPIVGGFRAASTEDERVQEAAAFAAGELGSELREVESAETQSVAGTNYRIVLWTTDGSRYRVVVYQPLRGEMRLSSQEQLEVADIGPATAD